MILIDKVVEISALNQQQNSCQVKPEAVSGKPHIHGDGPSIIDANVLFLYNQPVLLSTVCTDLFTVFDVKVPLFIKGEEEVVCRTKTKHWFQSCAPFLFLGTLYLERKNGGAPTKKNRYFYHIS